MYLSTHLRRSFIVPGICLLATAVPLIAGGFYLSLEKPSPADARQVKEAVLVVKPYGCHQPEDAVISASAEGLVNGRRETIELKLHTVSNGVYALKRQWPTGGVWLVAVRGVYLGAHRTALLELAPDGTVKFENSDGKDPRVKLLAKLTTADIDARLRMLVKERLSSSQQASN